MLDGIAIPIAYLISHTYCSLNLARLQYLPGQLFDQWDACPDPSVHECSKAPDLAPQSKLAHGPRSGRL